MLILEFQAIVALTFAQYAAKPFFIDCEPPENAIRILAALCLSKSYFFTIFHHFTKLFLNVISVLLTAINCISTKLSMKVQDIFTAAKLLALISIIFAGLYSMGSGK